LQLTSRLAAARAECQERAAVYWLTFILNQFTAAPAYKQVCYPILGPGLWQADVGGISFT